MIVEGSTSPVLLWNVFWGEAGDDRAWGIALDSSNNIIVTGHTVPLGAASFAAYDGFIAKYSNNGTKLWDKIWGGTSYEDSACIAVDSEDKIIMTGSTASYGMGGNDAIIIQYSPSGAQLLNATWGGNKADDGIGIALDSKGNIVVAGRTNSFGVGGGDAFVVKYSPSGVQLWNATWGGPYSDEGYGVAIGSMDDIIITGSTSSFGMGSYDAFAVKFSSYGIQLWNATWGGNERDCCHGVALDLSGNILVIGDTFSFTRTSDYDDMFIVEYSSDGRQRWNTTWGGNSYDDGLNIAVDSLNDIVVIGDSSSFGVGTPDTSNVFLAKYGSVFPPGKPQNLVAIPRGEEISLSWEPPPTDGGAVITNYRIYRGTASNTETLLITTGASESYNDRALTKGQIYYYKVSALNVVGEGTPSDEASATLTEPDTSGLLGSTFYLLVAGVVVIAVICIGTLVIKRKSNPRSDNDRSKSK